jgi:hypothetical protein
MRFILEASHVDGDFSSGRLEVRVARLDDELGVSHITDTYFSVPPDFHTHNDSVAAALMMFAGHQASVVRFNFAVSPRCAALLTRHYGLDEVGPIDPRLAPRAPGSWLAVNFSGGLDSTALVVLLRDVLNEPIRVVSTDYGGFFAFERQGYANARQDIVCRTDLREQRLDRVGRFNAAVPLLFADYLDLRALTIGDPFCQVLEGMRSLADGEQPWFLRKSVAYEAGGLGELHLVRLLNTPGLLRILMEHAPERLEAGFRAAAVPGSQKHITKGLILKHLFELDGQAAPAYLQRLTWPSKPLVFGRDTSADMRLLYIARHCGPAVARRLAPNLNQRDLATVAGLSLTFQERYNPDYVPLLPSELRARMLDALHGCGIYPWDERDWREVGVVRGLLQRAARRVARRRTPRLT